MLNERGIKAVTPSALNTPAGQNHSPTVTPCNSPGKFLEILHLRFDSELMKNILKMNIVEGSPTRDRSPEPLLTKLYTGADMIRRKFVGSSESDSPERSARLPSPRDKILLSRQEKRALRSLRLMEKVESIGLENIMHTSPRYHGVGISPLAVRSRTTSPMTQLTSLKNISHQKRRSDDPYAVDKETIKAVLNKGLSHESLLSDITTDGSTTSSVTSPSDRVTVNDSKTKSRQDESTKTPQKIKQMQRQKSRRSLINGAGGGQRPDLGTVGPVNNLSNQSTKQINDLDSDVSSVVSVTAQQQSYTQSFVGSISSLFFGRKGGLL